METLPEVNYQFNRYEDDDSQVAVTRDTRELFREVVRAHLAAMLVVGWHSAHRINVLIRADLDWLSTTDEGVVFTADQEKSHDEGFSSLLLPTTDPVLCPVKTLLSWFETRAKYVDEGCSLLFPMPTIRNNKVVLVDHMERGRQIRRKAYGPHPTQSDLDVIEVEAYRITYSALLRRVKALAQAAGVTPDPDRYFATHSTRRGVITTLRAAGIDPMVIARTISGHRDVSMVLAYDDSSRLSGHAHPVSGLGL